MNYIYYKCPYIYVYTQYIYIYTGIFLIAFTHIIPSRRNSGWVVSGFRRVGLVFRLRPGDPKAHFLSFIAEIRALAL